MDTTSTPATDLVSRKSATDTPVTGVLKVAVKFTTSPEKDSPPPALTTALDDSVTDAGAYVMISAPPADAVLGGEMLPDASTNPALSVDGCREPSTVTTST
jgi:hypothetical protein